MAQDTFVPPFTISSQALQASNTTWAQYKAGGLKAILDNLVAANPELTSPSTQATVSVTGGGSTGGNLAAGAYLLSYTYLSPLGETKVNGRSNSFTVSAGNIPRVTIGALPTGAVSANIYLTPPGGAAGSETLYASGVVNTTFDLSYAAPADLTNRLIPPINTSGPDLHRHQIYALITGPITELIHTALAGRLDNYRRGDPIERRSIVAQHRMATGVMAYWYQALSEAEALVAANMPTAYTSPTTGTGIPLTRWTLP